ncbi:MAG: AAA family ATPase [Flavobacteriaceae bacterium]|nr:AAA family ATPase [Flavobacteriaceae bacterium]
MKANKDLGISEQQEVNLKSFLRKVYQNKKLYFLSVGSALTIAFIYFAFATAKYEVSTSILIDPSGSNRVLSESESVDGGVGLIEVEKNLFNEIGIIKSFSLISQTVQKYGLDINYYAGEWPSKKEYFEYFPFEVTLDRSHAQLYGFPFEIKILSNFKYLLTLEADNFYVSNPVNGSLHEVNRDIEFTKEYSFGSVVKHEYFSFTIDKPDNTIFGDDFEGEDLSFVIQPSADVTNGIINDLEVDNIDIQASIFRIVSTGPVVDKEIAFLKGLTDTYVANKLSYRNEIASTKEAFIREQLAVISDSLVKSEVTLELFKKDSKAVDLSATASNALNRTQRLQTSRSKIQLDIKYYNSMIELIENNRHRDDFILSTSTGITDPQINQNILKLQDLYAERSRKKFFVTSNNEEMNLLNEQIRRATDLLLGNLNNAVQNSNMLLGGVQSQLANYDGVIDALPTSEKQLLAMQRQATLYENLFNYLSQELAKTGIAKSENTSDIQILDQARMVGNSPISPKKELLTVLALMLGALVPTVWLVLFSPNDVIENEIQITSNTEMPLVASIIYHDPESTGKDSESSLWRVKESFRDLSAKLRFFSSKKNCVIALTSIMPEEGKTYCTINLGITLAETGKKTLIIDTDLRKPSIVKGINAIVEGKGLSNYLQGDIKKYEEIIYQHEKLVNLNFIPTAVAEGNVHQLLSDPKMKSLVKDLKDKYDYILLDTPAVGLVSDFLLFWDLIDINLYVVRRQVAKIGFLKDLENLNLKGKKKKSCIIYNDALKRDNKYGYGSKYGESKEIQLINDSLSV